MTPQEIRENREKLGMSHAQLAERVMHADGDLVAKWEDGRAAPSVEQSATLNDIFGRAADATGSKSSDTSFGAWVGQARHALGLTLADLAGRVGASEAEICDIETNPAADAPQSVRDALERVLGKLAVGVVTALSQPVHSPSAAAAPAPVDKADMYEVAFEQSVQARGDQTGELSAIRDRLLRYLPFISSASAFLVGAVVDKADRDWLFIALAAVGTGLAVIAICCAVLLVLSWSNLATLPGAAPLIAWTNETSQLPDQPDAQIYREFALRNDDVLAENEKGISRARKLYFCAIFCGALQLVVWVVLVWCHHDHPPDDHPSPGPVPDHPTSPVPPPLPPPTPPTRYTVMDADCLWDIANRFYGDPLLYPLLVQTNNIGNPNIVWHGQVLLIPRVASIQGQQSG